MADGIVQIAPDSTGKKVDTSEITVGANTVERQRIVIADPTTAANLATVSAGGALKVDASTVAVPITDDAGSLTVDNGGTFAIQDSEKVVDNAGFTDGTTKVLPAGFILDEVAGTALTENDTAAARIDSKRSVVITLEDATTRGQRATILASGSIQVAGYQPTATTFSSITGTGTQASTSTANLNIATLTLRTFTGTTPSITWKLQASDDNTNWVDLQGINNSTGQVGISWTQGAALGAGTAGSSVDYTIGGYTNVRINVTAISGASATAAFGLSMQAMPYESSPGALCQGLVAAGSAIGTASPVLVGGSDGTNVQRIKTDTLGNTVVSMVDGYKTTYRMAVRGFTPVASASSPIFSIQGSASKTVRITHIKITSSCTTGAALPNDISLQKFSALTGGTTGNTPTGAKNDTNNAGQTAICLQYSAVPTTATVIGGISAVERMYWVTAGATVAQSVPPPIEWTFGNLNGQGLVLRGTSEFYGIVLAGIGTTPVMSIWIEWTEE